MIVFLILSAGVVLSLLLACSVPVFYRGSVYPGKNIKAVVNKSSALKPPVIGYKRAFLSLDSAKPFTGVYKNSYPYDFVDKARYATPGFHLYREPSRAFDHDQYGSCFLEVVGYGKVSKWSEGWQVSDQRVLQVIVGGCSETRLALLSKDVTVTTTTDTNLFLCRKQADFWRQEKDGTVKFLCGVHAKIDGALCGKRSIKPLESLSEELSRRYGVTVPVTRQRATKRGEAWIPTTGRKDRTNGPQVAA